MDKIFDSMKSRKKPVVDVPVDRVDIESLVFRDLHFSYPQSPFGGRHGAGSTKLFEGLNFNFPMNEMVWIRSESGRGRSTLLQLLSGICVPTRGSYLINGVDVSNISFSEFLPYRLSIGYGFDYGGLINNRTILENIILPLQYHKITSRERILEKAMNYIIPLGLEVYKDIRPALVPGRVRKLACLVRALILEPQLLLLDDPTVGLNFHVVEKYFQFLSQLQSEGKVRHIFLTSFDEEFMSRHSHRVIHLHGDIIPADPSMDQEKGVIIHEGH